MNLAPHFQPQKPVPLPIFVAGLPSNNSYPAFLHASIASLIVEVQEVLETLN